MEFFFNIWDDYPEYEDTYGYFEMEHTEDLEEIFSKLAEDIFQFLNKKTWECEVKLDHTEIDFKNISYEELEEILEYLQTYKHPEHLIHFYSES